MYHATFVTASHLQHAQQPASSFLSDSSHTMQTPPTDFSRAVNLTNGLFVCGDHRDTATLDGALKSGRRAAEAVLAATAALPVSSKEVVGTTV